jgi:hypothetical protein
MDLSRVFGNAQFLSRRGIFDGTGISADGNVDQSDRLLIDVVITSWVKRMRTRTMLGKIIAPRLAY